MNVNRQNNCYYGRQPVRPMNVIGASKCCNDATINSGIILGGCGDAACNKETTLSGYPIAMAYVPWQSYGNIYPLQQALRNGTMFQELDLDFAGRRCN